MRRSPALILIAALLMTALTARLGWWQLDRAAQKRAVQESIEQRAALPPLTQAEQLPDTSARLATHVQRRVQLQGRWLAARTIFLDNRPMAGRAGFVVVTPLALSDGTAVLVQRGWLPRDATQRTRIAPVPTPEGHVVTVIGRLAPPPSRIYEFDGAPTGAIRQNVDIGEFAVETGLAIRPVSIVQTALPAHDPPDNLQRDWPAFQADLHKHYGYAFQWFALSALTALLYVWFQLIRPRRTARAP